MKARLLTALIRTDSDMLEDNKSKLYCVKFSLLLALQVPAIILSLLIFLFVYKHRTVLHAPQNQAILSLLVVNFIQLTVDVPFTLNFYYLGYISIPTSMFCTWRTFSNFTLSAISEYLMATISIQRHMLIFNGYILRVHRARMLLYNLPLLFCLIYPILFYVFAVILYPCDGTQWYFAGNGCGFYACYLVYNKVLGTVDWLINNGLPMIVNALANAALFIRVIKVKRRRQRRTRWRQQRWMTLQLFYISSLYIFSWTPSLIVGLIQMLDYATFLDDIQADYLLDITLLVCLLLPWICLGLIPELRRYISNLLGLLRTNNTVVPMQLNSFIR